MIRLAKEAAVRSSWREVVLLMRGTITLTIYLCPLENVNECL